MSPCFPTGEADCPLADVPRHPQSIPRHSLISIGESTASLFPSFAWSTLDRQSLNTIRMKHRVQPVIPAVLPSDYDPAPPVALIRHANQSAGPGKRKIGSP